MGLFSKTTYASQADKYAKELSSELENFQKGLLTSHDLEHDYERLHKITSLAFEKIFGIHYKFTYEDLKLELKEKNLLPEIEAKAERVCDELNDLEFDKTKISKDKLLDISSELSSIIGSSRVNEGKKGEHGQNTFQIPPPPQLSVPGKIDQDFDKLFGRFNEKTRDISEPKEAIKEGKKGFLSKIFGEKEKPLQNLEFEQAIVTNDLPPLPHFEKELELVENRDIISLKEPDDIKIKVKNPFEEVSQSRPHEKKNSKKQKNPDESQGDMQIQKFMSKITDLKDTTLAALEKPALNIAENRAISRSKKSKISKSKAKSKNPLPKFDMEEQVIKKESLFKNNLSDLVNNLEQSKKVIHDEKGLLEKEKAFLEKEKKLLKKSPASTGKFTSDLSHNINTIETREKNLKKQEKEIEDKITSVKQIEISLKTLSENLDKDNKSLKQKSRYLKTKEKILEKIRKEINKKYWLAVEEIDKLRLELKEKEENFLKLQKFYQLREDKLAVEESNLLKEKKEHSKFFSQLISRHLEMARGDLQRTEFRLKEQDKRLQVADKRLFDYEKKSRLLAKDKERIEKLIEEKRKYFDGVEESFKSKDPEFENMDKLLEKRKSSVVDMETKLMRFDESLEKTMEEIKSKKQSLEIREIDVNSLEKEFERLKFEINNQRTRIALREKQLEKRISSYDRLRTDISKGITREKRSITRIQKKLQGKGLLLQKELNEVERHERAYGYTSSLSDLARNLKDDEEIHVKDITITHEFPEQMPGNPAILDILRLLNKARQFVSQRDNKRARETYLEIQTIFEDLEEDEKSEIYPDIVEIFKPKKQYAFNEYSAPIEHSENIDALLQKFQSVVDTRDTSHISEIYERIQSKYSELSKDEKSRYYPRIMEIYSKVGV